MKYGNCLIYSTYSFLKNKCRGEIVLYRKLPTSRVGFTFKYQYEGYEYSYKVSPKNNGKWYWYKGKSVKTKIKI